MKAQITPTKIRLNGTQIITPSGDEFVDLLNCRMCKEGTVLAIQDLTTGTVWTTDFTFSGVAAVLAAAPGTGGFFVLT
jgi:hypothetical protein